MQTYATCRLLKSLGHTVTIINLVPKYIIKHQLSIKNLVNFHFINILQFLAFRRKYLPSMTVLMSKINKKRIPKADYTIVGSDQVWNPAITKENATSYFLDFAEGTKKISLSSSFGINKPAVEDSVVQSLNSFSAISVREETGEAYLRSIIHNKPISRLVDPTIALGNFEEIVKKKQKKSEIYTFVFSEGRKEHELIKEVSVFMNLPVHKMSMQERVFNSSPVDWISNFKYYDCIITNSFHGLVFSLLFKKNFFILQSTNESQFTRLSSLLKLLNLEDRFVQSKSDIERVGNNSIDYDLVFERLNNERKRFVDYVSNAII